MAKFIAKVILIFSLHYCISLVFAKDSLRCNYHNDHTICPGDILVFACSVNDGIATVWRGSIFNCPNSGNEIVLRHSTFEHGSIKTCNDGTVVAFGTEVTNSSYTSQLNVTVSPEMHNGTIECVQDGTNVTLLGACTLTLATGKQACALCKKCSNIIIMSTFTTMIICTEEPLDDVHVSDINPNQFTVDWSPLASNCLIVTYIIITTNCGVCPNTTSDTFITCTNLTINGQVCSVTVVIQTNINIDETNINSEHSGTVNIALQGKLYQLLILHKIIV